MKQSKSFRGPWASKRRVFLIVLIKFDYKANEKLQCYIVAKNSLLFIIQEYFLTIFIALCFNLLPAFRKFVSFCQILKWPSHFYENSYFLLKLFGF